MKGLYQESIYSSRLDSLADNHQYQGRTNNCGPCCLSMILMSLNKAHIPGNELACQMEKITWQQIFPVIRKLPNSATLPWGITGLLAQYGIRSRWHLFSSHKYLLLALNRQSLILTITGKWRPLSAHYMILVSHLAQGKFGFINSAMPSGTVYWLEDSDFLYSWRIMGNMFIEIFPS